MRLLPLLLRDADAGDHAEKFLVTGVATILVIRGFLHLTGYPQIGGGKLHIAHMLWGGFFLTVALGIVLTTLNRQARPLAALIGGVGFGFFIDELGKFITRDNDYFYQPTVALIYVVFVVLFLVFRAIDRRWALTANESLTNALELMQDMVVGDFDAEEKRRALLFLDRCQAEDPRVAVVRPFLERLATVPSPLPGWYVRFKRGLRARLRRIMDTTLFPQLVGAFFIVKAAVNVILFSAMTTGMWLTHFDLAHPFRSGWDVSAAGRTLFSLVSGGFVLWGVVQLQRSRRRAYESFRRSLLVTILLTQFFVFYDRQFAGLVGLGINLLLLGAVNGLLARERGHKRAG